VVGFFHPFCSAGGGGERVLWKAIQVLGDLHDKGLPLEVVVYTIDSTKESYKEDLLQHVQTRFSITPSKSLPLTFVHLQEYAHFLDRRSRFSLLMESWGTMRLAYKALEKVTPHLFFDTTGCAFSFFVARILAGCQVAAYVHYPTISTDMLAMVWERRPSYNHNVNIAKSALVTYIKLIYYGIFAAMYGFCGSLAKLVMVNSTWTCGHVIFLWRGARSRITIVFPPCDVESLKNLSLDSKRERVVLSIGQFRPEKDHELQIRSLAMLREDNPDMKDVKLVLLGSCRGEDDEARVEKYQALVKSLALDANVEFVLNQPYSVVKDWLGRASVGLHTMWNEHFGIGVVEMMAAGLLVVAHDSGGPKTDIIVPFDGKPTGFLASTCEEYADCIKEALGMDKGSMKEMRQRARASALRFSDQAFSESFEAYIIDSGVLT
jgi:alpha-1,2-mannosyltransferase